VAVSLAANPSPLAVVARAQTAVADGATDVAQPSTLANVSFLPWFLAELTPMQRYILARAATHTWTDGGSIPFRPGTGHQRAIAMSLATPDLPLLVAVARSRQRLAFRLSRLGERAARCVLRVMWAEADRACEEEFDRMRALVRNTWEISEEEA
jgi:hypothetical protein